MNAAKQEQSSASGKRSPLAPVSDPQAILEAFESLANSDSLWAMLQEVCNQMTAQVAASGAAILQRSPRGEALRLRAQSPANDLHPVGTIDASPEVQSNAILERVLKAGQVWQGDFSALSGLGLEETLDLPALEGRAVLKSLPYRGEVRALGLVWDQDAGRRFSPGELTTLRLFLRHASIAVENRVLLQEAKDSNEELEALRQASLYLTSSLMLDEVLHAILESVMRLLGDVLDAHIFLYDGHKLSFGAAMWSDGRKGELWSEPRRDGLTYTVAESGDLVVVPDMNAHPLYENAPADWGGAIIGAPLRMANQVVGVMNVAYDQPRQFSERELRLITMLADQAAIAVHNANLHSMTQEEAHTDALTGLPNRRAFDQRIKDELRRSERYGHAFALVMMDIDGFKRVNDLHGHQMGDQALREIGNCLRYRVRGTDFLARFGGDEFVLVLPETKSGDAAVIVDKLQDAIRQCEIEWGAGDPVELSLSIGVALYPRDGQQADELVSVADQALYGRKSG